MISGATKKSGLASPRELVHRPVHMQFYGGPEQDFHARLSDIVALGGGLRSRGEALDLRFHDEIALEDMASQPVTLRLLQMLILISDATRILEVGAFIGVSAIHSRLPKGYRPKKSEPFMNARQRAYFHRKLVRWRTSIVSESGSTLGRLKEGNGSEPDLADRALVESGRQIDLRTRERARKLVGKIDSALGRLAAGTYGYCEEAGDAIALSRLEARPIATLSVEAQERHERRERSFRSDE